VIPIRPSGVRDSAAEAVARAVVTCSTSQSHAVSARTRAGSAASSCSHGIIQCLPRRGAPGATPGGSPWSEREHQGVEGIEGDRMRAPGGSHSYANEKSPCVGYVIPTRDGGAREAIDETGREARRRSRTIARWMGTPSMKIATTVPIVHIRTKCSIPLLSSCRGGPGKGERREVPVDLGRAPSGHGDGREGFTRRSPGHLRTCR
jgi:hypothetical protein